MASFPTELTVKRGFMGRSTGRIAQEIYIIFLLSSHEGLGLFFARGPTIAGLRL
jgi:hypothetical protein